MADSSQGSQARISLGAAGTTVGSFSEAYEFVSENLQKKLNINDTAGIRGTRSHPAERTRDGTYTVSGQIKFHATPAMLDNLLPRILGANESSDTFALAETLPEFAVLVDRVANRFLYDGCKVNWAEFHAQAGGMLELTLDIIGKTEAVSATAFPTITAPTDPPYVFHDLVATLVSSARKLTDVTIRIDNKLVSRFTNSQTATDVNVTDREITAQWKTPYTSDETGLYGINTGSAAAATFTFTNGGYSLSFAAAKLQVPDSSPVVGGKGEIFLPQSGTFKMSSTTRELVVTSDSTP